MTAPILVVHVGVYVLMTVTEQAFLQLAVQSPQECFESYMPISLSLSDIPVLK